MKASGENTEEEDDFVFPSSLNPFRTKPLEPNKSARGKHERSGSGIDVSSSFTESSYEA